MLNYYRIGPQASGLSIAHLSEFTKYLNSLEAQNVPSSSHRQPSQHQQQPQVNFQAQNVPPVHRQPDEQQPMQPPQVNFENPLIVPNPPVSDPAHRQPSEQQQQSPQGNSSDPTDQDMIKMIGSHSYLNL